MVFGVGKDLELKNQPSKGFSSKNNKINNQLALEGFLDYSNKSRYAK